MCFSMHQFHQAAHRSRLPTRKPHWVRSSIVSNKRSPKKPLHSRRVDHKSPPRLLPSPSLLTRMAIRPSEEELCGERKGQKTTTKGATSHYCGVGNWLRTPCIGRGRNLLSFHQRIKITPTVPLCHNNFSQLTTIETQLRHFWNQFSESVILRASS